MSGNPVFVYGTLRKGGSNHFRMAGTEFAGEGKVAGRMWKLDWYPVLILGGETFVKGEIYRVDDRILEELDRFEGITPDPTVSREYRRVMTAVNLSGGGTADAWIWEWTGDPVGALPLAGEDWLSFEPNPS